MSDDHETDPVIKKRLTIGELSESVDIPVETLRTWERRYGFPDPGRTASGHRRYDPAVVPKLEMAQTLIARGHRPSMFMHEEMQHWHALAGLDQISEAPEENVLVFQAPLSRARAEEIVERWMQLVMTLDGEALRDHFERAWGEWRMVAFLEPLLMGFLVEIGEAWHAGDLTVLHEQFASRHIEEFLTARWQPLSQVATKPAVIVASPPGEFHILGLHAAAWIAAAAGHAVIMAPRDVSTEEIVQTAHSEGACALLISASSAHPSRRLAQFLGHIREGLSDEVSIVLGGSAQLKQRDAQGVTLIAQLADLHTWIARGHWKRAISSPHS